MYLFKLILEIYYCNFNEKIFFFFKYNYFNFTIIILNFQRYFNRNKIQFE